MLKVFDQNKNAKGFIVKYKDLCIESDLSTGDKSLSFVYFAKKAKDIRNEYYVETQDDRFVVKEADVSSDGWPEYRCQLDLEDLESYMHERFSAINATLEDAARLAVAGTGWRIDTDITKVRSVATLKATPLAILGKIKDAWMCEVRYDTKNKIVYFRERFGEDRGVYFTRQLNLRKVDCKSDSYDFYTRIIPIGADGLRIEDVNGGKDYVENYQYSTKVRTLIWEDTNYEDAEALKEDAQAKLEDLSKPKKSYSADVIDLARQSTKYSTLSYGLGDTVLLLDEPSGIRDRQRIVKLTEYPNDPGRNTCELSNTTLTFEEQQAKLEAAAAALEDISNADGTINGVYVHGVEAGGIVGIETVINGSSAVQDLNAKVSTASGNILQINGEIDAVKGRIGTLETTSLKSTEAALKYATIEQLTVTNEEVHRIQGDYADFKTTTTKELAAQTGIIDNLSGQFSSFQTSMSQELITAKGWMLEGAIGDAQISKVSANKLGAGTIDTAIVTVAGTDGRLQIQDNTIQIKDANRVRVQIGKDAGGDYSMSVWDASGQLIWDALGATENTIQRKIIRDRMVADDAAIQALKLDLQSFNTALTNQGVTISGTVVQVGNKTLNVALSEQIQLITEHGETLTDHATRITASENDIRLKVSTQDFNSYKTTVNGELTSAKSRLSTAESSITAMQGQIALKVEQTDIDSAVENLQVGGRNYFSSKTKVLFNSANEFVLNTYQNVGSFTQFYNLTIPISNFVGKKCILSFDIVSPNGSTPLRIYNSNGQPRYLISVSGIKSPVGSTWMHQEVVIQVMDLGSGKSEDQSNKIEIYCPDQKGCKIRNVKFEIGTKATDWTPAPEDIDASITAVDNKFANYSTTAQMQSEINLAKNSITQSVSETYATKSEVSSVQTIATQTADKFNWLVRSGTSATDFTLTDRTAQLITEKLTIKDSTGASTIISGGKMDINKIFAQDITATGTIRGVTLEGAKGHIGGWTISNQALYCGIGVSEFDENGAEINSVSYDTYIRAAERENDKVFEVKTKRGQAASESVFYVTAKGGLHAENGTISIFNFSPYGFYADFTNDGVSDYRFAKDYFIATAYNASNVRRAYFYADSEMTTQSVNGRAIIFGKDTIDLRTNGAIRVMTETEQVTGVEHVVINPNGTITASGEVQGNIIRSANSVIGSSFVSGGSSYNNGYIELSGATPFIDFHFGNTSTDYTSRIIEWERNRLTIVNGANQTPLQIMGCSNNEASIKYVNNTSGDWWIAGAGTGYADMKKFGFWYGPASRAVGYIDYSGNFQAGASIYSTGNMHAANGMTGNANGGIYIGTGTIPFIYNAGNSGDVWLQTYVGGGWKWYSIGQGLAAVSSDKRLKDDVADSTVNALPVVKRVKVRSFLRNDTKEYYKIGVVADELEEIDDLLTYGGGYTPDGHPIYKNVNVLQLSVYAVKAIQELDAKVEDTSRNAYSINSRVDGIDAQMNNLRNQLTSAESTISNLRAEVAELRRMIHAA